MRPYLLDTCAVMWIVADSISQKTEEALLQTRRAGLPLYVSPVTAWEIGMLARRVRFRSNYSPQRWFERLMDTEDTVLADLPPKILMDASFLPGNLHNDPMDRIIAATAREYGFTVMTRDRALLDYAEAGYLSVLEC
jgi:PIN domain nuclease of toxin-antitoxin system